MSRATPVTALYKINILPSTFDFSTFDF